MNITFTQLDGEKVVFDDVLTFEVSLNEIRIFYFNKDLNAMVVTNRVIDGNDVKMEVNFEGFYEATVKFLDRIKQYMDANKKFHEEVRLTAWRKKNGGD